MAELELEVTRREGTGKGIARKLRRDGRVPAIVYGGHRESVAITVDQKSISDIVRKGEHGIRSIFLVKMAGTDQSPHAMIKDIQFNPISRKMNHIDFVRVAMDEAVRVNIPVHVIGTSIGVKNNLGVLDFQVRELHVECLPGAIPDAVEVDVSALDIHDFLRISDLPIPEGVKVLDDMERIVVTVTLPRAEAVVEVAAEEVTAEPELIKKGKIEGEEA